MTQGTGQALIDLHTTMKEQGYGVAKIALDAGYSYFNQSKFYEELLYAKGIVNRITVKVTNPDSHELKTYTSTITKSYSEQFKVTRAKELAGYGRMRCDRSRLSTLNRIILNCRADKATIVIEIN